MVGGSPPVHLEAPSTAHQCSMHRNPRHTVHTSAYSTHGHPRRIRHDSHCMKRSVGATVTDASFPVATESVGWDTPTGRCGAGGWRKQHAYMHWWCIASARMHAACAVVAADAHVSANSNHCTYALSIYVRASMCTASAGVTVSVTVSASVGVRVRARVSTCERVCVCELYVLPTLCWCGWIMASVVLNSLACLS
jgi:hypothetical protein